MTIYEVLEILNQHYTPNTQNFINYVLWTSDYNGGFLRTCYRKKGKPLKNFSLGDVKFIIVGFQEKFDPTLLNIEELNTKGTQTKMQIIYVHTEEELDGEVEWCKCLTPVDITVFEL